MSEYKVQFEVFEGPLDLLLYLIKKEEVDIYEVNLTKLATQFIEYIDLMRQFDLEVAGEFLVMASTLMYIKSRELLPVDKQVQAEEEDDGEDPRWELIRQLVEYKKFKDAAAQLQVLEERQEHIFPRLPVKIEFPSEEPARKTEAGIFDLLNAVNSVLKRFSEKNAGNREIFEEKWSVSGKIETILSVIAERPSVRFSELFEAAASRTEIVCTFLALLELIRLKQLACVQPEPFMEIEITKAVPGALPVLAEEPTALTEAALSPVAEIAPKESTSPESTESTESTEVSDDDDDDDDDTDASDTPGTDNASPANPSA